jgi:hypothetical protein
MKKKIIALGLIAAATALSGIASASWWIVSLPTTGVGCWEDGTCYVQLANNVPAQAPQCQVQNQIRFSLAQPGGQEMYRSALSAFLAGRNVRAQLSGCSSGGDDKAAAKAIRLGVE